MIANGHRSVKKEYTTLSSTRVYAQSGFGLRRVASGGGHTALDRGARGARTQARGGVMVGVIRDISVHGWRFDRTVYRTLL